MKPGTKVKLAVLGIACVVGYWWGNHIPPREVTTPDEWEKASAAGVRAMDAGDVDAAQKLFDQALDIARNESPHGHKIGTSLHNLGWVQEERKDFVGAANLYRRALTELDDGDKANLPEVGSVLKSLGMAEAYQKQFEAANEHLRRAIDVNAQAFGRNSGNAITSWRVYSGVLLLQGRVKEAADAANAASRCEQEKNGMTATTRTVN